MTTGFLPLRSPAAPQSAHTLGLTGAVHEAARQQAVERYAILDTAPESAFDELAQLASMICQTPISLISLVDRERQWFKARIGIQDAELPRSQTLCNVVIEGQQALEIADARLDARVAGLPAVTAPDGIRFYAGVPLHTAEGYCLGAICVADTSPRVLTDGQRQALNTIAEQVMAQLEHRRRQVPDPLLARPEAAQTERLTALITHELKAPLSSMLTLADVLLDDVRQGHGAAVSESLTVLSNEVARLQRLIETLQGVTHQVWPSAETPEAAPATLA